MTRTPGPWRRPVQQRRSAPPGQPEMAPESPWQPGRRRRNLKTGASPAPPDGTRLMRAVLQRVRRAKVTVGDETTGEIAAGWLVLLGVAPTDSAADVEWLAEKVA